MKNDISINESFHDLLNDEKRFIALLGGAGSGKSHFAAQKVLLRAMMERDQKILVARKVRRTMRQSVFALLLAQVYAWGLASHFQPNYSDLTLTCKTTNSAILCVGLDDPEKIKSIHGITSAWLEEPTEMTEQDVRQINLRIRGAKTLYRQIIMSFNPVSRLHWIKSFIEDQADDRITIHHSTYKDNVFLDEDYRAEIEALKEQDENYYRIYGLGEWGSLDGLIYPHYRKVDAMPESETEFFGLDFGFNNPSALVRIRVKDFDPKSRKGQVYLQEEIYQSNLTSTDLIQSVKAVSDIGRKRIYADPAEPGRIEELRRAGLNVFPASKGPGSVNAGISFCKALDLNVEKTSLNLMAELESYTWQKDHSGKTLDQPVKFRDHALDAMRYALWTHYEKPQPVFFDRKILGV